MLNTVEVERIAGISDVGYNDVLRVGVRVQAGLEEIGVLDGGKYKPSTEYSSSGSLALHIIGTVTEDLCAARDGGSVIHQMLDKVTAWFNHSGHDEASIKCLCDKLRNTFVEASKTLEMDYLSVPEANWVLVGDRVRAIYNSDVRRVKDAEDVISLIVMESLYRIIACNYVDGAWDSQ